MSTKSQIQIERAAQDTRLAAQPPPAVNAVAMACATLDDGSVTLVMAFNDSTVWYKDNFRNQPVLHHAELSEQGWVKLLPQT